MGPLIALLQTPPSIPILPTAFPTPPPPTATLVAAEVFWDIDRWLPAISAARTIWYLEYVDYFMYFFIFIAVVLIGLRLFGFGASAYIAQRQEGNLQDVERQLAEQQGGIQATSDQIDQYLTERERIRDAPERARRERERQARRASEI